MKYLVTIFMALAVATFCMIPSTVHAATVYLTWDANPAEDAVVKYRVYFGNYSGNTRAFQPVGTVDVAAPTTTATVANLDTTKKWFFRVTAINASMESLFSNVFQLLFIRTPSGVRFQRIDIR